MREENGGDGSSLIRPSCWKLLDGSWGRCCLDEKGSASLPTVIFRAGEGGARGRPRSGIRHILRARLRPEWRFARNRPRAFNRIEGIR